MAFTMVFGEKFDEVSFIAAFKRACHGFDDGLPIHYPRARQQGQQRAVPPLPEGKAFEWFVANDRKENQYTLQDLQKDEGLRILNSR